MNRVTERLPIDAIIVGDRLREDFGDIASLATSIQTWGLIHPLTVDFDNNLVAGERRLRAMRQLGYTEIEVRRWENLTKSERRELELEENLQRKDLSAFERSKNLAELATVAKIVDRETEKSGRTQSDQPNSRPQNNPKAGSSRRVSERISVPKSTIRKAEKHVVAAETYPVLQGPGWKQYHAIEAAEVLNQLPEKDRGPLANLIDQPALPPTTALEMLRNVASKSDSERKEIITLAQSPDSRDRSLASTKAAELPPMPDQRIPLVRHAQIDIKKAISMHPGDPEVPEFRAVVALLETVVVNIKERSRHGDSRTETPAA